MAEPPLPAAEGPAHPVRILHVFGRLQRGGAELRTLELMRHLGPRYRPDFCTLSGLPGALDGEVAALGGRVHPCPLGPGFPLRFWRLLRAGRYDVVHAHVFWSSGPVLALARLAGVPGRIAHFRSTQARAATSALRACRDALLRCTVRLAASHVLAVSEGAMAAAWGPGWRRDRRRRVVYSGLDLAPFQRLPGRPEARQALGLPPEVPLCIHVGRFAPAKNHRRVLSILAAMVAQGCPAHLLLVGAGTGGPQIRRWSRDLGVANRVHAAGLRPDVPRLLAAADLLLFPSLWEGLPGAVLEAVAAGLPVLASSLPGIVEIQRHFPAVFTLPLSAGDAAWARQAIALLGSPPPRAPLAAWGQTPFSMARAAEHMARIWDEAAAGR